MNETTDDTGLTRIQGYSHAGEGVGRIRGKPVFIPLAIRGELVRTRILQEKSGYLRGELQEVVEANAARVKPPCRLFPDCGGCQLLHLGYDEQLYCKRQRVLSSLQRIGGLQSVEVGAALGMADPWHYRHTARFHVARDEQGLMIGFFRSKSRQLQPANDCLLLPAEFPLLLDSITSFLKHPETAARLPVREIVLRKGLATGELLIIFLTETIPEHIDTEALARLGRSSPGLVGIVCSTSRDQAAPRHGLGKKDGAAGCLPVHAAVGNGSGAVNCVADGYGIADGRVNGASSVAAPQVLAGRGYYQEKIAGTMFQVPASAFFQNNPAQAEQLVAVVRSLAQPGPGETMIDLYGGVGLFSLTLADLYAQVWGIEENRQAVQAAGQNALINNIRNCRFAAGKVERLLPAHRGQVNTLILDPPRQGCSPGALKAITSLSPGKIVYVSCDPATLARDLAVLTGRGYRVEGVQPIDLFPHTHHVEIVVLLELPAS